MEMCSISKLQFAPRFSVGTLALGLGSRRTQDGGGGWKSAPWVAQSRGNVDRRTSQRGIPAPLPRTRPVAPKVTYSASDALPVGRSPLGASEGFGGGGWGGKAESSERWRRPQRGSLSPANLGSWG